MAHAEEQFPAGARVRIRVDAADVKQGTLGRVQSPVPDGEASVVVFDGRETPMLVLNASLELVTTRKMAQAEEQFPAGARVRITVDAADVKQGTLGTVQSPVPEGKASVVAFDGRELPMLVLNASLELVTTATA